MEEGFPHTTCFSIKPHMPAKAIAVFSLCAQSEGVQPEGGARSAGFGLNSLREFGVDQAACSVFP